MTDLYFKRGLELLIQRNFRNPNFFKLVPFNEKYRIKDDEKLFKGKEQAIEVYFNDSYLCEVNETHKPDEALAIINFALLKKLS